MTVREWTFNATSIASDTDVPSGDGAVPSIKTTDSSGGSTTRKFEVPTGNTINGQTINGIDNGGFTCWAKETTTGGDNAPGMNLFGFRYISTANHYRVIIDPQNNMHQIVVRVSNVDTNVKAATVNTGVTLSEGTWYKIRVTFWEAASLFNIQVEIWDGTNWIAQGAPSTHAGNNHKGSTNKFAVGGEAQGIGSTTLAIWFENLIMYKQK